MRFQSKMDSKPRNGLCSMTVDLAGLLNCKKDGVGALTTKTKRLAKERKSNSTNGKEVPVVIDSSSDNDSLMKHSVESVCHNEVLSANKTIISTSLSNDWKKIFKRTAPSLPKKRTPPSPKRCAPNSPKRTVPSSPKRTVPNSPKRCGSSSPRRSAPNSPKRTNSLKSARRLGLNSLRKVVLNNSLETCSPNNNHHHQIARQQTQERHDVAPYSGLCHVQQKDLSDPLWHLGLPTRLPLRELPQCEPVTLEGKIGLSTTILTGCHNKVQFKVCSEGEREAALTGLSQSHPNTDIHAIYSRYHSLTTRSSSLKCSVRIKRNKKGKIVVDRSLYPSSSSTPPLTTHSSSLKCSIRVKCDKKGKILVDHSLYPSSSSSTPLNLGEHMHTELWSEVYRPMKSDDVIGNKGACLQLRDWLGVWKTKCTYTPTPTSSQSTSVSKARSKPLQSKSKASSAWWVQEQDSDFVAVEHIRRHGGGSGKRVLSKCASDSEEEEEGDCGGRGVSAAALVCGPHGCGKTAGVYAIAEELGFKVYEVNSGSIRSKVQLLSSLREATLSHHVSVGDKPTSSSINGLKSYFQQAAPKVPRPVALEKSTLILLEEVDVLFESDRGFWSAVYELLMSTKRPFIMTCSDVEFNLDCDHIKIVFDYPPIADVSLHIELLSLVHGVSISAKSAHQIAESFRCDVRKTMNFLHTQLSSVPALPPPSSSLKPRPSSPIHDTKGPPREENQSQSPLTELRTVACTSDTMASIDILSSDRGTSCHSSSWWRTRPLDSLVDELSEDHVAPPLSDVPVHLHDMVQGCSHSKSHRCMKEDSRTKELHTTQMKCAAVFSSHTWTLSHVALVTEGLPYVRLMCDAENVRQSLNASRRFRHYFKPFPVELCDLQTFTEVSKYS